MNFEFQKDGVQSCVGIIVFVDVFLTYDVSIYFK